MGNNKKQQILELLDTLTEAITYIKDNSQSDYTFMSEIAIQAINYIINTLESSKKCDNQLMEITKNIKQNILKLHNNRNEQNIFVCEQTLVLLDKLINIISYQLQKKTTIVFMPYNASMWNSLESIWKSASEDLTCECYVVPIPYYKLISKEDKEVEHVFTYEGDKLPSYVPVINYNEFDLEKVRPDIIYIHNQYDECNNATRVDSRYFSYNLKKHTNMLVYSTYGILGTYPVSFYFDFYSFIASRNFDKVIVQSPAFNGIAEFAGVDKKSILTLGSPKFDALINSLKNQTVSNYYTKKFKNKLVFLWTTNIMKIINGGHKVLDEIEEVFNIIKNSKEYGLIYRPHPLELEYVKSKAPECFERYNTLLSSLENTENMVLDKNTDYYESFKISDALITDRSSVLIEYMATRKPVLIYDVNMKHEYYDKGVFDIFSNYIVGEENMDLEKFIDLVKNKKDYKKEARLDALKTVLLNIDGTCGQKVHQSIKKEILENYF